MMPWIGCRYPLGKRRLAIVSESHYLPDGLTTKNADPGDEWYASCEGELEDTSWINTNRCVRHYLCTRKEPKTYKSIGDVLNACGGCTFHDVAFFNYIFRPVDESARGYSNKRFNIGDKDKEVAAEIMRWFICRNKPTDIIIASAIIVKWSCIGLVLSEYPCVAPVFTHHPNAPKFKGDVRCHLKKIFFAREKGR